MFIFTLDKGSSQLKNLILRNFLAKSISQLDSIKLLNSSFQLYDCYILYRAMVDRLAHIYYLERTNSYEDFDNWSFIKQMEANNNGLSDESFNERIDKKFFTPSNADRIRYKTLKKQGVNWSRPDIQKEFKEKGFYFLYKFGYDYASSHVHPMANDGMIEYYRMTQNPPESVVNHFNYQTDLIIDNSSLIASMIARECLNYSTFKWRKICFDFIDSFMQKKDENSLHASYLKLKYFIDNDLEIGELTGH